MRIQKKKLSLRLLPLILLFALYPLVFAGIKVKIYLADYPWFPSGKEQYDFFLYAKSMIFLALAVMMLLGLVDAFLLKRRNVFAPRRFWPLYDYGILVILSTVCSVNRELSVHGMWEQYETVWVLLGYIVTVLYTADVVQSEQDKRILSWTLAAGAGMQGLIGCGQLVGFNLLESAPGRWLLGLGVEKRVAEGLVFRFGEGERNRVYMTLYNPNYAGVYIVMLLPIVCGLFLQVKQIKQKIVLGIIAGLLLVCLAGSGSRTGMLILAIEACLAVLITLQGKRRLLTGLCVGIAAVSLIVGYDRVSDGSLRKALKKTCTPVHHYVMRELRAADDGIHLRYRDTKLLINVQETGGQIMPSILMDGDKLVDLVQDSDGFWMIPQEQYAKIRVAADWQDGYTYLYLYCKKVMWHFVYEPVIGSWFYVTQYGKMDDIVDASTLLPGWERAFTGRGYIWGRALLMLPKRIIVGSGPDTFIQTFPQNDYRMRANTGPKMLSEIPSKPHSMYLQIALQTGVLSLLCLVIFWIRVMGRQIQVLRQGKEKDHAWQVGVWLGLLAYLLMGLLNDSIIAVAPLFWGIVGMSFADRQ